MAQQQGSTVPVMVRVTNGKRKRLWDTPTLIVVIGVLAICLATIAANVYTRFHPPVPRIQICTGYENGLTNCRDAACTKEPDGSYRCV